MLVMMMMMMMMENSNLIYSVWTLTVLMIIVMFPAEGEALFALNVSQDVYEAEEKSNITLTWFFTVSRETQLQELVVDIFRHEPDRGVYLFIRGKEILQSVDEIYRERVSCNKELFETGRIECIFRNLTVSDSGPYRCVVVTDTTGDNKRCLLNVTAASHHQAAQDQPKPEDPVWKTPGLYIGVVLVFLFTAALFCCCCCCCWRFHRLDLRCAQTAKSGMLCLGCCPRDPAPDKQKKMDRDLKYKFHLSPISSKSVIIP